MKRLATLFRYFIPLCFNNNNNNNNNNTYSMEQGPSWEANRISASQEILRILWNLKVHYHLHKSPPPVTILSQLDPVHTPTLYFLKTYLNNILSSKPESSKVSFPQVSSTKPYILLPLHTCYMSRPFNSSRFYHPNNIWCGVQIIQLLILQVPPLSCYLVHSRPKYPPQHPILKHSLPAFLPQCQRPSFTPIQNNRQNHSSVYLDL